MIVGISGLPALILRMAYRLAHRLTECGTANAYARRLLSGNCPPRALNEIVDAGKTSIRMP